MIVHLCLFVRNEDDYVKDWINWYLKLGFDNILIYDNNEDKSRLQRILKCFESEPKIQIVPWDKDQYGCYRHCWENNSFDWLACFDCDEILELNNSAKDIHELLENYSDLLKVTYTIDDNEQSTKESTFGIPTEFNSLAWQKHTLTASVTFDGVEITSSPVECDVTGLPYTPSAMVEADWENASWNYRYENGTIQLGGVSGSGECTATSKMAFYIPENIGVKVNTNVTIRASHIIWWQNTTFTVNINGTTIISQYSDKQDNDNTGKNYTLSGTGIFSPNACEVKLNSSYEEAGPWSKVHTLHILYN